MLNFTSNNTPANSFAAAASAANPLALASDILAKLGLDDQRAEVIAEEQTANHQYVRLRSAIEKFAVTPNGKNKIKLTQVLNKEIKRLQKEHDYIKAKQLEYQQAAEQSSSSSNYVAQWRDWFTSGVKQFFGSDNEYQAQRYAAMAEARQEQIEKLKKYKDEVNAKNKAKQNKPKLVEEDVIELNTDDASPMRRRLLTLPVTNEFQVNTYTIQDQFGPAIGTQPNGDFVVTWVSDQDGSDSGIYAKQFDINGTPLNSEFQVNTYTTSEQSSADIGVQPTGNFVIVWASSQQDGDNWGIYAQRFNVNCTTLNLEFRVNTYTTNAQVKPAISIQSTGDFVITWQSMGQDGDLNGIYAQRFSVSGSALGLEFRVNTYTLNDQSSAVISTQSNGNFVIAWQSMGQDGDLNGIYAQRFNPSGSALGSEFRINSYTANSQSNPAIGLQPNDGFVVTWTSTGQDGDLNGVYAQRFISNGSISGLAFQANTYTSNNQNNAAIGTSSVGDFIITWQSSDQDGSGHGVFARIFRPLNMGNHTLTVNQGRNTTVTTSMIDATSGGTPNDVTFTVSNVVNGYFEVSGVADTQFTKQNILDGVVKFVHNGSPNAPSFSVAATDGNETLGPYAASINFIPTPAVSSSTGVATAASSSSANAQSSSGQASSSGAASGAAASSSANGNAGATATSNSTPSSSARAQPPETTQSGLSSNAKIGIGVGAGAAGLLTVLGIYCYRRQPSPEQVPVNPGSGVPAAGPALVAAPSAAVLAGGVPAAGPAPAAEHVVELTKLVANTPSIQQPRMS